MLRIRSGGYDDYIERDRKQISRRMSTGQIDTTEDRLGGGNPGLQRSFSAPQLSSNYMSSMADNTDFDKEAIVDKEAGRTRRSTRRECQKQKHANWLNNWKKANCSVTLADEDSYDDETWSPEKKKRKVFGGMDASDDEDEETPKKKRKVCKSKLSTTLAPAQKPLSPVIQGMLEKLAISKADHTISSRLLAAFPCLFTNNQHPIQYPDQ